MDSLYTVHVTFQESNATITHENFFRVISYLQTNEFMHGLTPVQLYFPSFQKTMYCDMDAFEAFRKQEITREELHEKTVCDFMCRNNEDFTTKDGVHIDKGSLWMVRDNVATLIDLDRHVEHTFTNYFFTKI